MSAKNLGGRPVLARTKFLRERCAQLGVSSGTLAHWENDGVDLADDESVKDHIANLGRLPKGLKDEWKPEDNSLDDTPDMTELKDQLLRTQDERTARRLATQIRGLADAEKLEILQSKYISLEEYTSANIKLGAALKAASNKAQVDLPQALYGQSLRDMQKVIRAYMDKMLETIADKNSDLWR